MTATKSTTAANLDWFLYGASRKADRTRFLLQLAYAQFVEARILPAGSFSPVPTQSPSGKSGPAAAARRSEPEAQAASACRFGQVVLGDLAAALAGMEAGL